MTTPTRVRKRRPVTPPPAPTPPRPRAERLVEAIEDFRRNMWRKAERAINTEARVGIEFEVNGAERAAGYVEDAFKARADYRVMLDIAAYVERFAEYAEEWRQYALYGEGEDPHARMSKEARAAIRTASHAPPAEREARELLAAIDCWKAEATRSILREARNRNPPRACVRDVMEWYLTMARAEAIDSAEVVWTAEHLRTILAEEDK